MLPPTTLRSCPCPRRPTPPKADDHPNIAPSSLSRRSNCACSGRRTANSPRGGHRHDHPLEAGLPGVLRIPKAASSRRTTRWPIACGVPWNSLCRPNATVIESEAEARRVCKWMWPKMMDVGAVETVAVYWKARSASGPSETRQARPRSSLGLNSGV
jgi:hypothetical protein